MNINLDTNAMADTVMSIVRPVSQHVISAAQSQTEALFTINVILIGIIAVSIVTLVVIGLKIKSDDIKSVLYVFIMVLAGVWLIVALDVVRIKIAPEYQTLKNIKKLTETNNRR